MRRRSQLSRLAAGSLLALVAAGCGAAPTGTAAGLVLPASSAARSPAAAAAAPMTKAQLTAALLTEADAPDGYSIDRSDSEGSSQDGQMSASSKACAPFLRLLNSDKTPGSRFAVGVNFSGGADGDYLGEALDSLPSGSATKAFLADLRSSARACSSVSIYFDEVGRVPFAVTELPFGGHGDASYAVRLHATSGRAAGVDLTLAAVASKEVLVSTSGLGADSDDVLDLAVTGLDRLHGADGTHRPA